MHRAKKYLPIRIFTPLTPFSKRRGRNSTKAQRKIEENDLKLDGIHTESVCQGVAKGLAIRIISP